MRTLRIVGYVLGAILVLAIACRPFSHDDFNQSNVGGRNPASIPAHIDANGDTVREYTGTGGEHVKIVEDKNRVQTITIDKPVVAGSKRSDANVQIGPMKVRTHTAHGRRVAMITNDLNIPLTILLQIAFCVAAIVATLLGLALSRENDGHLELAWTKPASRDAYAFACIAMDVAGILATALATLVTVVLVLTIYGGAGYIVVGPLVVGSHTFTTALFGTFFALSFYGIVLAATSSLRRGGLVLSILWPAALILPTLVGVRWMNLGLIARALNTINPVAYFVAFATSPEATQLFTFAPNGEAIQILAVAVLFIAGITLSLAQWRRLEA